MTALFVVSLVVAFVVLDVVVRILSQRWRAARVRRHREALLATALRLDVSPDAKTLTRVEIPNARARILAVDDEPVVLDSLRKVLALEGFSIDTVETGPEVLGLVQRHDYDLVFTDLRMPDMDGVEVVKAVRHLRPDVDVAVITGYATIESAVETVQHGAADYIQKPFTPDELLTFVEKLLVRREARLERERRPTVRVVPPPLADGVRDPEFCIPGGFFLSDDHAWVRIEADGDVTVGLDDFARKALGAVDAIELPRAGQAVQRHEALFGLRDEGRGVRIASPVSGDVVDVNEALAREPSLVIKSPYDQGWICRVRPADLAAELPTLRIGQPAVAWYQDEIVRLRNAGIDAGDGWETLEERFLARGAAS